MMFFTRKASKHLQKASWGVSRDNGNVRFGRFQRISGVDFAVSEKILVIGHRGWPQRHPDNTLRGFIDAAGTADGVELDVRRSADGKLMLSHDPVLGGLEVAATSWATLMELDLGDGHHPILLDEAMAALPETPVQLEVKNWPADSGFEPDHRIALEAASRARTGDTVTSFNWESMRVVKRHFPEVRTGLAVEAPLTFATVIQAAREYGHEAVVVSEQLVDSEPPEDLETYVWTVNRS